MEQAINHIKKNTYIFSPLIQSLHQLVLNMEHVNKHQTTQHMWKNAVTR